MKLAYPDSDWQSYDYLIGNHHKQNSITEPRYELLSQLNLISKDTILFSLKDKDTNSFTTWQPWYSKLDFHKAYDIHRSLLPFEILIESDYPEYEQNWEAARHIGKVLEEKGFVPAYWYSGGKSVHCLPTKTAIFIRTRTGIKLSSMAEIERLFKTKQFVEVMGPKGFVKVKSAVRRKQEKGEKLVRIYTRNGKRIDLSQNHLQLVNRKHKIIVVKAQDVLPTDRIAYSLIGYEGTGGTYDLGKFLGLFLAEGSLNKNWFQFTLDKTEQHLSDFIKSIFRQYGSNFRERKEHNCIRISFYCATLSAFIENFSIGKRSKDKGIKCSAYGMSKEFRQGIVDGWFEGDGCHTTKNHGVTVSKGLSKSIEFLCTSLGIRTSRHCYLGTSGFSGKRIIFYRINKISGREGLSTICCPPDFDCSFDTIKKIHKSKVKKTDLIDIEIDSDDHLFCLANSVITHNCHVLLDPKHFLGTVDMPLQERIVEKFKYQKRFTKKFMEWLRSKIVLEWGKGREYDTQLIKEKHLIRSELSRNKNGYKTFLGTHWKDLSPIPLVCNERTRIMPKYPSEVVYSRPWCLQELLEEFLEESDKKQAKIAAARKEGNLVRWLHGDKPYEVPDCVKFILSDEFSEYGDGMKRALFILANELKRAEGEGGEDDVLSLLQDWKDRMGCDLRDEEILYRVERDVEYRLSCSYVHEFLRDVGCVGALDMCKGNTYK